MFDDLLAVSPEEDPTALDDAYRSALADVVAALGREALLDEHGVDEATLDAVGGSGDRPIPFDEACRIAAAPADIEPAVLEREALDDLLLAMTTAVVDVEAVAANVALDASSTGIQQRIEGRAPMTLGEYARIRSFLASRRP